MALSSERPRLDFCQLGYHTAESGFRKVAHSALKVSELLVFLR